MTRPHPTPISAGPVPFRADGDLDEKGLRPLDQFLQTSGVYARVGAAVARHAETLTTRAIAPGLALRRLPAGPTRVALDGPTDAQRDTLGADVEDLT